MWQILYCSGKFNILDEWFYIFEVAFSLKGEGHTNEIWLDLSNENDSYLAIFLNIIS